MCCKINVGMPVCKCLRELACCNQTLNRRLACCIQNLNQDIWLLYPTLEPRQWLRNTRASTSSRRDATTADATAARSRQQMIGPRARMGNGQNLRRRIIRLRTRASTSSRWDATTADATAARLRQQMIGPPCPNWKWSKSEAACNQADI